MRRQFSLDVTVMPSSLQRPMVRFMMLGPADHAAGNRLQKAPQPLSSFASTIEVGAVRLWIPEGGAVRQPPHRHAQQNLQPCQKERCTLRKA
jgi:hypothetical protein